MTDGFIGATPAASENMFFIFASAMQKLNAGKRGAPLRGSGEAASGATETVKLSGETVPARYHEVLEHMKQAVGQEARVKIWEELTPQIRELQPDWHAFRMKTTDGSVLYEGRRGFVIVIDSGGEVYGGNLNSGGFKSQQVGKTIFEKQYSRIPYEELGDPLKERLSK